MVVPVAVCAQNGGSTAQADRVLSTRIQRDIDYKMTDVPGMFNFI